MQFAHYLKRVLVFMAGNQSWFTLNNYIMTIIIILGLIGAILNGDIIKMGGRGFRK